VDRERVVEPQQPGVRVAENLDHHGQLHRAGRVEPQVRTQEQRVGPRQRVVVEAHGLGGRPGDARRDQGAEIGLALSPGERRPREGQRGQQQGDTVPEHGGALQWETP
jgi:hypothetical protein